MHRRCLSMYTIGRKEDGSHQELAIFTVVCMTKMSQMAPCVLGM